MENQEILNAIAVLTNTIDTLNRAGASDAIKTVTDKVLELISKLV